MLVEQAQRVMCESRELLEQREAQLKQQEQFLEQPATIAYEMLRDRRFALRLFEIALVLVRFDHIAIRTVNANHSIM